MDNFVKDLKLDLQKRYPASYNKQVSIIISDTIIASYEKILPTVYWTKEDETVPNIYSYIKGLIDQAKENYDGERRYSQRCVL